jgi:hypothetical protein
MTHQGVSAKFPTRPEPPPPENETAAPVPSRGSGTTRQSNLNNRTYAALSLPDKAGLASGIAADGRLRASHKVVAFALLFRFHNTKTGQCNPSYEMVAKSCCLTRRAVIEAINRLEAAGWLNVERTNGGRNRRNQFRFLEAPAQTVKTDTSIEQETVNSEVINSEPSFTPNSEPEFTRIEPGNLNTGKNLGNLSCSNEGFERFWSVYPRKAAKKAAARIFERITNKGEATAAELIEGAERYARFCHAGGREPRFIKHPTTWLNGGCWSDEIEPSPKHGPFPGQIEAWRRKVREMEVADGE